MKTFTTCAEKKAKQFFNLLQGYTKGIRIIAVLTLLLTMGVGQVWAYVNASAYVYFDPNDKWNYTNYYFASIQETGNWQTKTYKLSNITNTKLYYLSTTAHNDAGFISFGGQNGTFNGGYWGYDSFKSYITMCGEKCNWGLNYQNTYLFYPSANTKGTSLNPQYLGGGFNDLNSEQTIKTVVDGTVANSKATISITSYKMTGNGTATEQTATLGTGAKDSYITAARTATTTLTVGTIEAGYQFDGWYTAATGGTQLSTSTTYTYYPTAATTVYARFSTKQHTVLFGKQGNGTITAKIENTSISSGNKVNYGSEVVFTAIPSTGYQIEGWYSNSACTTPIDNGTNETYTVTITGGTNVYVKFEEIPANSHNITYTEQGTGWTYGNSNPTTAEEGATVTFVVNPTAGYRVDVSCSEVALTKNGNNYTFTMPGKDVNIKVEAKPEQYTVTLNKQSGEGGTSSVTATYLAVMPDITVPTRTGYTFNGYFDATSGGNKYYNADGSSAKNWDKTADATLYAQWTANTYDVTFNKNANDATGTMSSQSFIYDKEKALSENKFQYTGYDFAGWAKSSGGNVEFTNQQSVKNLTATPDGIVELFAKWTLHEYNITYNLNGGTNHASNPRTYTLESTITLQAPTRTGYSFAGWYTTNNFSGDPVTEITQGSTGDKTFYAKWIEQKEIYLVGEFGWDNPTEEYKFKADQTKPGVYKLTRRFEKRDRYDMTDPNGPGQPEYEFKLQVNGTKYTVKTENGKKILQYTRQSKTKVLSDGTNYNSDPYYNLLLQADISGEYNVESQELTIEHPAYQQEASYIVGDFSDGATGTDPLPKDGGAGYDWTEEKGIKFNNDNTAVICFNGTGKKWEFKIKINGIWYGAEGLVIEADGTYTLSNTYAFQSETNCAIQTSGVNGCYTFTYTDNGDGTIDLTVGFPKQSENPTTVYLKPNDDWKKDNARFALYYWNNNGNSWKDMSPVDCNGDYYSVEVPKGYSNFIFCRMDGNTSGNGWNNKWNQTNDLTLPNDAKILYDIESTKYLYFTPYNNEWKQGNERYAAYFFETDKSDVWVSMTDSDGDGTYECEKPEGYTNVIFCRMNGSNSTNDWNNKWNQSADQKLPNDKNHCNETGYWSLRGDHCGWTTYTEPTYDVTINITGKGAIVINGQTYEGTSEGTTTLKIEDVVVNTAFNINSITAAERWDYTSNGTIEIASNGQEPLKVEGSYEICGLTTINLDFMQKYCLVTFLPNPPRGVVYPEQINPQVVVKGEKAVQPTVVDLDGYLFGGWYPNGSEYTDANKFDFDTPIEQDIELCARWVPYEQCIFFKNNLNWDNIYVYTFKGDVWGDDGKGVYPANRYEYGKMTQIGYTDVYYYILTQPNGFNYIAFSDYDMHDYAPFWGYSAIYRGDRSDKMQLFIPEEDQTPTRAKESTTEYYNKGIWMKYNSTESGYKWSSDKNGWSTDINPFIAPNKGGYSFTTKVSLEGGQKYLFKINNIKNDWFGHTGTMTQDDCTDWWFKTEEDNATIQPNATSEYLFTIYLGDGKVMLSLEYPLAIGDYRLAYKDKTADSFHPGHYIRKRSKGTHRDTTSFFVLHDEAPAILLQECTAINTATGVVTWKTLKEYSTIEKVVAKTTVYNFVLLQNENVADLAESETHLYTGDFYIRTDDAPGGWDYFRQNSNKMTFSSYAQQNENFDHYFCKWIHKDKNVRYTVANDYSYCISDTLYADDIIGGTYGDIEELPANANVRFMWDSRNNSIGRAYIAGSSNQADRFLVVEGKDNNLKDAAGNDLMEGQHNTNRFGLHANEEILKDMGNWIYQVDVKANKDAWIKLTALYDGTIQYFKGAADGVNAYIRMLTSDATDTYKIRLIYDFKINQLIIAWLVEDNTITEENTVLGADMMIIRHNQERAKQLNFDPNNRSLEGVGKAYAVLTFDKYFLNNRTYPTADGKGGGNVLPAAQQQSQYARALYWVSFPFNVKLSEVSGFGEYGDYWILEYYDGAARAANGLWADTDTYWRYITNPDYTIQAGQGYVLSLNLNKMGYESTVFTNTAEVSLFFPSTGPLTTITGELPTAVEVPAHECTIERENGIHKIYDSHWNVIGVPGFADIENVEVGNHLFVQDSLYFYYEYLPQANEYRTKRANNKADFQTMYSYMIQYHGGINWSTKTFNGPAEIAARRTGDMPSQYDLRLELATDDQLHDQTFLLLDEDKRATAEYDVNLDLTKIMNKNASIYTLAGEQRITLSGNTLPMEKATVPVGVRVDAAGEYTFRMPDGTDGISVFLIDNQTGAQTNMLLDEYTITLDAGTCENRFYLAVDPDRTATSVENIGEEAKDQIKKFLIDGQLFIRTADGTFDAKGQRM